MVRGPERARIHGCMLGDCKINNRKLEIEHVEFPQMAARPAHGREPWVFRGAYGGDPDVPRGGDRLHWGLMEASEADGCPIRIGFWNRG